MTYIIRLAGTLEKFVTQVAATTAPKQSLAQKAGSPNALSGRSINQYLLTTINKQTICCPLLFLLRRYIPQI